MKKYVKPELFYERYELSQHIADCAWELNSTDGVCTANGDKDKWGADYTETLFTSELGCTIDSAVYQDYCYQNGAEAIRVAVS